MSPSGNLGHSEHVPLRHVPAALQRHRGHAVASPTVLELAAVAARRDALNQAVAARCAPLTAGLLYSRWVAARAIDEQRAARGSTR